MVTYVITLIRVHISLTVCFQLQYGATVHRNPMKSKHMNTNTHIYLGLFLKVLNCSGNAHSRHCRCVNVVFLSLTADMGLQSH